LGFTLRSFPLSQGIQRVSAWKHPHTVFPTVSTAAETTGRPRGPRFLGFDPCESPWPPDTRLAHRQLAAPLGFTLLGHSAKALARIPPSLLSRASPSGSNDSPAGASEFRSAFASPRPPAAASRDRQPKQPF